MNSSSSGPIAKFSPPPWPGVMPQVEESVLRALRDGSWGKYEGPYVDELCHKLAIQFDQPLVTPCSSGTIAVELALRGLGVQSGDEVILGGYDFPGNFRAIEAIGAIPVLVDMRPDRFLLDREQLQAAASEKTKALLVSHLHGDFAPMPQIAEWAKSKGVAVLEDAAQCPGATLGDKPAASFGDAAVLSFGGSKLLSAGRGGAVLTRDERVHQRIKIYQERGNLAFPLSELQAAALLPQLETLKSFHERRRGAVRLLDRELLSLRQLAPDAEDLVNPAFYKFPLLVGAAARESLCSAAQSLGIPLFPGFRGFAGRSSRRCRVIGTLPNVQRFAAETAILHHSALLLEPGELTRLAKTLRTLIETHLA